MGHLYHPPSAHSWITEEEWAQRVLELDVKPVLSGWYLKFAGKWMDLENIILSEVTQPQKNTH